MFSTLKLKPKKLVKIGLSLWLLSNPTFSAERTIAEETKGLMSSLAHGFEYRYYFTQQMIGKDVNTHFISDIQEEHKQFLENYTDSLFAKGRYAEVFELPGIYQKTPKYGYSPSARIPRKDMDANAVAEVTEELKAYIERSAQDYFNKFMETASFFSAFKLAEAYQEIKPVTADTWLGLIDKEVKLVLGKLARESKLLSILAEDLSAEKEGKANSLIDSMPETIRETLRAEYNQKKEGVLIPQEDPVVTLRFTRGIADRFFRGE